MESIALEHAGAAAVFEFRATVSRYVGLCEAVDRSVDTGAVEELAATGLIGNKVTTAACVARSNRKKLDLHQIEARMDFVSAINAISVDRPEIGALAADLAKLLNDHIGAEHLAARNHSRPIAGESDPMPVSLAA
jgi:hypothetical protein